MLILDENVSENEIWRLREARLTVRVIGQDIAVKSVTDENIIPVLLKLKKPTFFTRDRDFWKPQLRHDRYAIVFMDIPEHEGEIAKYIALFLRHRSFNTATKRLGRIFHIQSSQIQCRDRSGLTIHKWER
jgi:hypothetical protein